MFFLSTLESASDREKFEQLYLTYRQTMFYAANGILKDPPLAEDAVHQAFMRVMNHMENISQVECPQTRSWVVIIVRNIAINLYNSRKRKPAVSFEELEEWTSDFSEAPDRTVEAADGYGRLVRLIGCLPEGYRSVLLLKYDNGYSTAEIASMLSLTEENVKKRLQRARKKLEEVLGEGMVTV